MESLNSNNPLKRRTNFGAKSLQTSENDDVSSRLVGRIVEKGMSGNQPLVPPPKPSVLPFPVARHRSHGPHWAPVSTYNTDHTDDNTENEDSTAFDTVASFAEPVRRKEKKGLNFSRWRELIADDKTYEKSDEKHIGSKNMKKTNKKVAENSKKLKSFVSNNNGTSHETMLSGETISAQDIIMGENEVATSQEVSTNGLAEIKEEIMGEGEVGLLESSKRYMQEDKEKHMISKPHLFSSDKSTTGNKEESTSLEGQIDVENRARLENMSANEIAEAQGDILRRINPAVIEALKRRGQNKLTLPKRGTNSQQDTDKAMRNENGHLKPNGDNSLKIREEILAGTNKGVNVNPVQENLTSARSSLWNTWSEKVEAARELRFSLDGNVVDNESPQVPTGDKSTDTGYNTKNVSERDFLRTEGDPAAAGYTIKEAITLTRSVIPSQRALALHLLASVLDKAIHNICQNQIDHTVKSGSNFTQWGAIWAYALGPEPQLALSLRMAFDDNHNSVVLATAKVIQCILSCEINESYFDISEKLTAHPRDINTAPVFRSRPEIHDGFLQGGFWKYNAKPSNILPFGEDIVIDDAEGEHTIQDDMVVAGQDFVAGLVRMGVLQRICYLLGSDPSVALEEGLVSILVAIARHSPTCAHAIMKCERLLQTVVDKFTTKESLEVQPSKIKSVTLLKVLARSEKKNCIAFIRNGFFQSTTWHLYRHKFSLDQWVKLGSEKCKLSSALLVEQLRFWKVCVQYGYCISNLSDIFPSLCLWLSIPTIEKLNENNVLGEFAAVTEEIFLVLGTMSRTLPNFYSNAHSPNQMADISDEDTENWRWAHVGPMVDFATKWIALMSKPLESKIIEKPMLRVISAIMLMLSGILDRVIPEDTNSFPGGHLPWLPDFVPKIGLEIIKNGYLRSLRTTDTKSTYDSLQSSSFIEHLCLLRQQTECDISIASSCCLGGLLKVMVSIDRLIELANVPSSADQIGTREDMILSGGMVKFCSLGLRRVLDTIMNSIACEWKLMQSIEVFGRGGPAPGIGVGWGAAGGGFWSKNVLLAQADVGLLIPLLEIFQSEITTDEEKAFTVQRIVTALGACIILGPRDGVIMEHTLKHLLQVPVLKFFDHCVRHFMSLNDVFEPFRWEFKDDDFHLFSETLTSHFKKRWLSVKEKKNKKTVINENKHSLETIHEDLETSNVTNTTLTVEWAHQRRPLPAHWYLSPVSYSDSKNQGYTDDFVEVAKSGLFFVLGIEVMTLFVPTAIQSPVRSVPLTWKLHSLSVSLLAGMAMLEEEKTRDIYRTLQRVYGRFLDESLLSTNKDLILDEKSLAENGEKNSVQVLRFESEIHESYSTFVENLVEQFAAESYGDEIYARQISVYLHRCVDTPVRLAAWNNLSSARVLELLPPLENCIGKAEGYLEPAEDDESTLEAYVKSWVSGSLDRAKTRRSMAFTLVLHHLTSYIFSDSTDRNFSLRNKLVTSLLRDYVRNPKHEGMMFDLIQYQKDGKVQGYSTKSYDDRFVLLAEACEGNSFLLRDLEKLRSSFQKNNLGS